MIRLLLDMGLPRRSADDLSADSSCNAVHIGALGQPTATDLEIVSLAAAEGRVVVTHDSDFARIVATSGRASPSLIHLRIEGLQRSRVTQLLRALLPEIEADLVRGCIAVVTSGGVRIRKLPIG